MTSRTKNLVLAGGSVLVVGYVALNTLAAPPAVPDAAPPQVERTVAPAPSDPASAAAPSPGVTAETAPADATRRSYAIGLQDLDGLPPDASSGTPLELWVTWEPPVTDEPRLQKLIGDVLLERTIPGAVPEAPVSILLSVPADRVGDLMYADTFGKLSVALPD
jgi:hypothetical protein